MSVVCLFIETDPESSSHDIAFVKYLLTEAYRFKVYDATADESAICFIKDGVEGIKAFYEKWNSETPQIVKFKQISQVIE